MTAPLFESILLHGQVAVIRGASSHWPLASWTCADFRAQPGMEPVEQVYGEIDGNFVGPEVPWEKDQRPSQNSDRDGPHFAPLYWAVKESDSASQFVHDLTPTWDFVRGGNHFWKQNSAEIWFSPPSAGAKSHIDSHTQSTTVTQLVGSRRWRLAGMPADPPTLLRTHGDGHSFSWTPEITLTLQTGDVLIFPPGTIHDTLNLSNCTCAASLTHQYGVPLPYVFYRNNLRSFLSSADLSETWPVILDLVSLNLLAPRLTVSPPYFEANGPVPYNESDPMSFFSGALKKFDPKSKYIAFHDLDGDGTVSESEFVATGLEWLRIELELFDMVPPKFRVYRYFRDDVEKNASEDYWAELWAVQQNLWGHTIECSNDMIASHTCSSNV